VLRLQGSLYAVWHVLYPGTVCVLVLKFVSSSTPRTMARETPARVDCSGLALQWDASPEIRQRLRSGETLIHPATKDKILIKTASLNGPVLQPVCELMANLRDSLGDGKIPPSPAVEDLREEVKALVEMGKQDVTFGVVDKAAWNVRKFIAFVKLKIRKREVSTESFWELDEALWLLTTYIVLLGLSMYVVLNFQVMSKLKRAIQDPVFQKLVVTLDPLMQEPCLNIANRAAPKLDLFLHGSFAVLSDSRSWWTT